MNQFNLIPSVSTLTQSFQDKALTLFHRQSEDCGVYVRYLSLLGAKSRCIKNILEIPFMPISFFKNFKVTCGEWVEECIYLSSGTSLTGTQAKHYVRNRDMYLKHAKYIFEENYGNLEDYTLLVLLPSYQERQGSSLIDMIDYFLKFTQEGSAYFLHQPDVLYQKVEQCKAERKKTILFGVSYALLDYLELNQHDFSELIVFETGGMKGRRKEMTREELHDLLCNGFGVSAIHSEYGMTELMSQCYSKGEGIFYMNDSMQVLSADIHDPFAYVQHGQLGRLNIIDLANEYSCAFIETSDLGRVYADGSFKVEGRLDHSDVRGCNLLVSL